MAAPNVQPESNEPPMPENGLKREREDDVEQESKRQRTSPGKNSPTAVKIETETVKQDLSDKHDTPAHEAKPLELKPEQPNTDTTQSRRKGVVTDEKQRSKRLFGALLGNLNQPGDRTSKRRQEIEARRKAELQRQDDERVEEKQRRLEALAEHRTTVQKKVDEESMRTRHAYTLKMANFLQTSSEPKLYYKPWELRPDEEDRIEQQLKEAEALIERELAAFEGRPIRVIEETHEDRDAEPKEVNGHSEEALAEDVQAEAEPELATAQPTANAELDTVIEEKPAEHTDLDLPPAEVLDSQTANDEPGDTNKATPPPEVVAATEQKQEDDDGDHVVEGDEDTVIY
ncbi:hypothetical protein LTR56_016704 [Elasticomyces elasticus]|nr:hypothetical protein LTR56_016704 [Elasticomyces elasticus]KAK3663098.1 hypothetical protein LTR22_006007 [Elasticomyces elasticus]KAK4905682.1 hypothetical protein LTR49_025071 [Elasticomyces elasticus]KAK5750616.1 hypothetical protein LTS12_019323 [Elasticomyces elasticus]